MHKNINLMINLMSDSFQRLESAMPSKPVFCTLSYGKAYRYKEQNISQALIQKLARIQSTLRAIRLLLENGFLQEQAILQRTIDETNQDIAFLAYGVLYGCTELHSRYLAPYVTVVVR